MVRLLRLQDMVQVLQLYILTYLEAKLCKGGSNNERIHSIWNIGFESFRITSWIIGDGSDRWPG
jgi:hypothetical protein